jgi:hypothetical protein
MRYLLLSVLVVSLVGVLMIPNAFAENLYYYVDPIPNWYYSDYGNTNIKMYELAVKVAFLGWSHENSNLKFIEVTSQERADIIISWVKEFGTGIGGHAIYQRFIEVELGTDALHETWQPYSVVYVGYILTHEIGHTLGVEHTYADPTNVMYPTAPNQSFGFVEIKKQSLSGWGYFFPFYPSTNNVNFSWRVESDDRNHGFDVYVVPSRDALDKRADDKSFSYYSDDGCFAKNMLAVGGECKNVGKSSGLLVLMGSETTDPRVSYITVKFHDDIIFDPRQLNIPTIQKQSTPTPTSTTQQTQQQTQQSKGGGCLIATAAFGSEMAPQVQLLRELRDNTVLQTESGSAFMTGFNQFYYSFSPTVADYERENPAFKEAVKITLTPLLASLTLLQYADIDSESEMLGYGIGVILLNIGMYFVAPAVLIMTVRKRI